MNWYVYILKSRDESLYTGITTNLEKRLKAHNSKKGSKSLFGKLPVKMVYNETFEDRSSASVRESQIKKLSRKEKIQLIPGR